MSIETKERPLRRLNLFEPSIEGHRSRYLSEIVQGIQERHPGCSLRLCIVGSQQDTDGYREFLEPLEGCFEVCPLPENRRHGRFAEEFFRLGLIRYCVTRYPCDDLVIPYGDGIVPLMGMLPGWLLRRFVPREVRMESMLFRPEWAYPTPRLAGGWYQQIRRWATCRWPGARLHLSDYVAWKRAKEGIDRYRAEVSLVPEVFESWRLWDRLQAIRWLQDYGFISPSDARGVVNSKVISAPGAPSRRKGTVELIEAFVLSPSDEDLLLIWGRLPEDVIGELARRGVAWRADQRILVLENYVTEEAFRALFSITDLVMLPYQSHLGGVSSLFLIAAILRLQTVCDQRAWLGWASDYYQHGCAIDSSERGAMVDALERFRQNEPFRIASHEVSESLQRETMEGGFRASWC